MQPTWIPLEQLTRATASDLAPGSLMLSARLGMQGPLNVEMRVDYQAPVGLRKCLMTLRHESLAALTFIRPDDGYAWSEGYHLALNPRLEIDISQARPPQGFASDAIGQIAFLKNGELRLVAGQPVGPKRREPVLVDPSSWTIDSPGVDIDVHFPIWRLVAPLPDDRQLEIAFPPPGQE